MHILLIHQAFVSLEEPGGTRHVEMARYLAQSGHWVTIIASPISYLTGMPGDRSSEEIGSALDGRLTIIRSYTYPALHKSFLHRMVSFFSFMISSLYAGLKVKDVDLVWGTSPPIFQAVTAWLLASLKRASFMFEVRDLWPAFAIEVGVLRNRFLIRASEWLERFLYRRADLVVVNSPGFIEHVSSRGAQRVRMIPNGSDPRMFDPLDNGEEFLQAFGLGGKFVALYAGAHGMSNDLEILLQAADIIREYPDIAIVLLGDGKEKPALRATAAELDLDNVFFIPPLPKNEMPLALAAADACIAILKPIPLYATVYPNKVFDYMAAGRPVVCAIDGVIRKVIIDAHAGIYIPPGDPDALAKGIYELFTDPELGKAMGLNGRKIVESNFDRQIITEQMADLVEELVNEAR